MNATMQARRAGLLLLAAFIAVAALLLPGRIQSYERTELTAGDADAERAAADGMEWPIAYKFEQSLQPLDSPMVRRDPGDLDEWQRDVFYMVARGWTEYALIHVASENVRGQANQGQVGYIAVVSDGRVQHGWLTEGRIKERLPEMSDTELELLLGSFPANAVGVTTDPLQEGTINITATLDQKWLFPELRPAEASDRSPDLPASASRARKAGMPEEGLEAFGWQVCCADGQVPEVEVSGLRDRVTRMPAHLSVRFPSQLEEITVLGAKSKAEDSAVRAGLLP